MKRGVMETIVDHQQALVDAFGFDHDDLKANQAGMFSERQLKRLATDRLINLLGVVHSISILLASPVVSLAIGLPAFCAIGVIVASIAGVGIYACFKQYRWLQDDVQNQEVTSAQGSIESIIPLRKSSVVYFRINDVSFKSAYWETDEFKPNERYRIYYAPRSKRILSVEWLRDDDNLLQ
jgi:hypothetical protein